MFEIGEKIFSNVTGRTYTITWASDKITQAEVGFAISDDHGKAYFIKRLLSMKYPNDSMPGSPEMKARKRKECDAEYLKYNILYNRIKNGCGPDSACVPIIDYFRDGTFYYTVYRKVDSASMSLDEISSLPENEKYKILFQLVMGIKPLHSLGVIHGDLKPDNILIQKDGAEWRIMVIDMNDCYSSGEPDPPGEVIGTPDYYSPELYKYNTYEIDDYEDPKEMAYVKKMADDLTPKSDIFALGIIFCELFTGQRPSITNDDFTNIYEAAEDGALELPASIPPTLASIIKTMLDADYRNRPTINKLGDSLKRLTASPALTALKPEIFCSVTDDPSVIRVRIDAPSDSTVYYTLDGSNPTFGSNVYSGEMNVQKLTDIKAIAVNAKGKKSDVAQKSAWVKSARKVLSTPPQIRVNKRNVQISPASSSPADTRIFYTVDGSRPSSETLLYSGPFVAEPGVTKVRAVAIEPESNKLPSTISEANVYKAKLEKPVIHYKLGKVSMESPDGIAVYYTEDGSKPNVSSTKYTGPFMLHDTSRFIVTAVCIDNEGTESETSIIKRPTGIKMS